MVFSYKTVLLVGATSGIGLAFAERLVAEGSKVIVVGRRKDRLDAFVQKHGDTKSAALEYDINDVCGLAKFAETVTKTFPDLDCVFLNAGVQNPYDLSKPESLDLPKFHAEMSTNFSRVVDMTYAFLPFLSAKKERTSIIFTNSNLALVPGVGLSAYSASKAALNVFVMCLREELQHAQNTVRIIELWPPPVQTELHDYMPGGRSLGMPVHEYVNATYPGILEGKDLVQVGEVGPGGTFRETISHRVDMFKYLSTMIFKRREQRSSDTSD